MQDYTPLGSTATTTVKEGILNHEKNINALRSTYSGTAFPTKNLVAGLKCYRTDLRETYTYNGKTWDSTGYAKRNEVFPITDTGRKIVEETGLTDLNDVKCISYPSWLCRLSATTSTLSNCPTKTAFFLYNMRNGFSSDKETLPNLTSYWYYSVQILIDIGGNTWVRNCSNGAKETFTFGTWKKIASASDLANYYTKAESDSAIERQLKNGFTTASLTVSGETSVPTPSTENNSKTIANTEFVHGVVNNLVNGAPTALDTLQELASALGNDPNFATTILNKIGEKESKTDAQIEHEKLQNAIDLCLKGKKSMGITPETNPQIIAIPLERGIFPIQGYPDGLTVADKKYPYSVVVNFQGESGALLSFYAQYSKRELYFRVGWPDERGWGLWTKLATTDKIPTKVSQLSNDSGYQKTAEIPVVSQTQNGYMSKSDKAKLDGIAEGATNVTDYVQSVTESNGKVTVTKGGGDSTIINLVDTFYPVGTVYMSADKSKTKADFPFMKHGTWEEVPANLCLQTGDTNEAGTQRSAGLPNITGVLGVVACNGTHRSGAFVSLKTSEYIADKLEWQSYRNDVVIDASLSNTLYGASDTVQPPAYMIRAWVRTA